MPDCDWSNIMRQFKSPVLLLALTLLLGSCASARLIETIRTVYSGPPVTSIAINPGGGMMAEEIAMELISSGLNVYDSDQTVQLSLRSGVDKYSINSPEGLEGLRKGGVDALLIVKTMIGWDGNPQVVTLRLVSTHTAEIITGLSWENGWGGDFGSVADRTMRKSMPEAARQISETILNRIG